jgi:hypothetical protein
MESVGYSDAVLTGWDERVATWRPEPTFGDAHSYALFTPRVLRLPTRKNINQRLRKAHWLDASDKKAVRESSIYQAIVSNKYPSPDNNITSDAIISLQAAFGDDAWTKTGSESPYFNPNAQFFTEDDTRLPITPLVLSQRMKSVFEFDTMRWFTDRDFATVGSIAFLLSRWDGAYPVKFGVGQNVWTFEASKTFQGSDEFIAFCYIRAVLNEKIRPLEDAAGNAFFWIRSFAENGLGFDDCLPYFRAGVVDAPTIVAAIENGIDGELMASLT